jgi:hypothetical protein
MSEVWTGCPKLGYATLIISTYYSLSIKVYIQIISAYAIWCRFSCLYFILSNIFQIVKTIAKLHLTGGGAKKWVGDRVISGEQNHVQCTYRDQIRP